MNQSSECSQLGVVPEGVRALFKSLSHPNANSRNLFEKGQDRSQRETNGLPSVSIIIPTFNVATTIEQCLQSIVNQDYPRELVEVIVADGMSTDGSREKICQFPVILLESLGNAPSAMNQASRRALGRILLFADGDAVYPPHWVSNHVETLLRPGVAASGGPCLTWRRGNGLLSELIGLELTSRYVSLPDEIPRVSTMNLGIRASVFWSLGGFREDLAVAYDTEFGYRLASYGHMIRVAKEATAYHAHRNSIQDYLQQQARYAENVPRLFELHPIALKGDPVTTPWMNYQVVIFASFMISGFVGFLFPSSWYLAAAIGAILLAGQLGASCAVVIRTKRAVGILVPAIFLMRLYSWSVGGANYISRKAVSRLASLKKAPEYRTPGS